MFLLPRPVVQVHGLSVRLPFVSAYVNESCARVLKCNIYWALLRGDWLALAKSPGRPVYHTHGLTESNGIPSQLGRSAPWPGQVSYRGPRLDMLPVHATIKLEKGWSTRLARHSGSEDIQYERY